MSRFARIPPANNRKESTMRENGLIGMVFDLSFKEFVTAKVIKALFILGIVLTAVGTFGAIATGFAGGFGRGILTLILSLIMFFIGVLMTRIWCELVIVVFRIAENTARIADQGKS
jgi:polyferredoxin